MDGRRSRREVSPRSRRMDLLWTELIALRNADRSRSRSPRARNPSPPTMPPSAAASTTPPPPSPPPPAAMHTRPSMASPAYHAPASPQLIDLGDDTVELSVSPGLMAEMQGGQNDPSDRGQRPPVNIIQVTAFDNGRSVSINAPENDIGVSVLNVLNSANATQVISQESSAVTNMRAGGASLGADSTANSGRPTQVGATPPNNDPTREPSIQNPGRSVITVPSEPVQLVKHTDKQKVFIDPSSSGLEVQNSLTRRMIYDVDYNLGEVKKKFNFYTPCNNYQVGKCDQPDFSHPSRSRPNGRLFTHICQICWVRAKLPFHHNLLTCPFAVTTLDNTQHP